MRRGLFFALILTVWLGLDFQSLMMSVFGTYFFFKLEGVPLQGGIILLVALFSVAGPLVYRALFLGWMKEGVRGLLALQLFLYLLCTFVRESDVFAWATVLGSLVSGVAAVAVLRRLPACPAPLLGILLGMLVFLAARVLNDGLLVAVRPVPALVALPVVLFALAWRGEAPPPPAERPKRALQLSTLGFVLVLQVGLVLICNANLWSAKTPSVRTSLYLLSFGVGAAAGVLRPWLPAAAAGMGFALLTVLHLGYGLALGLAAHAAGCYGLAACCAVFLRRFLEGRALPIAGLQLGGLGGLAAFGAFLWTANPASFWIAFGAGAALLLAAEGRRPAAKGPAWAAVLLAAGIPALLPGEGDAGPPRDAPALTVVTTNARYGWTDDYRFDPRPYARWLERVPALVVGMQEVNKGSFYGGFIDVFEVYRKHRPGTALYGDANFGFGNALFTELEVLDSEVVAFARNGMIRRSYLWTLARHGGREIEVFVTHLSYPPHPNEIRQAQVKELVARLEKTERPWILMGDMNALPGEPEIAAFAAVAHPVFRERPDLFAEKTYPAAQPRIRLDYIFFSRHFDLVEQKVLDHEGASDHRPVRSVLELAR